MDIKGTRTEKNLQAAFAGESQARNRYLFSGAIAREAGLNDVADVFYELAENEGEHARKEFEFLGGLGDVKTSIKKAIQGERLEKEKIYPEFSKIAREEGFQEIADIFRAIAVAEKQHERRYLALAANVADGSVFKKKKSVVWRCRNCGYLHSSTEAPLVCPACAHPQEHFEINGENW